MQMSKNRTFKLFILDPIRCLRVTLQIEKAALAPKPSDQDMKVRFKQDRQDKQDKKTGRKHKALKSRTQNLKSFCLALLLSCLSCLSLLISFLRLLLVETFCQALLAFERRVQGYFGIEQS
jgi:hypothetical protein